MTKIGLDDLASVIEKELTTYAKETTDVMREVVEEVTDDAVDTLKVTSPIEDGHAKQNGGRVEGRKHIAPVEKKAIQSFEDKLRQKL